MATMVNSRKLLDVSVGATDYQKRMLPPRLTDCEEDKAGYSQTQHQCQVRPLVALLREVLAPHALRLQPHGLRQRVGAIGGVDVLAAEDAEDGLDRRGVKEEPATRAHVTWVTLLYTLSGTCNS